MNKITPSGKVRIVIVADHALLREGLARALDEEPDFKVVAHCASVQDALHIISGAEVDIALLDFELGQPGQYDFFIQAKRVGFTGRVLIVTAGLCEADGAELIRLGVSGIFMKHGSTAALSEGIRQVVNGQTWFEQRYLTAIFEARVQRCAPQSLFSALSTRECEVLRYILDGSTNRHIAGRLKTSEGSIKSIVQRLFEKTGVRKRSQLVEIALELYGYKPRYRT
jgi:DNA-binding NarL/FixJ family response regulator